MVEARSECACPDQLIDYGQNKKNLEALFGELTKRLKTVGPVQKEEKRW